MYSSVELETYIHPIVTSRGTTKVAICYNAFWGSAVEHQISAGERTIELPRQIPIVSSIFPFTAIQTLVTCSAAFAYGVPI
jgi:hypothetical protein